MLRVLISLLMLNSCMPHGHRWRARSAVHSLGKSARECPTLRVYDIDGAEIQLHDELDHDGIEEVNILQKTCSSTLSLQEQALVLSCDSDGLAGGQCLGQSLQAPFFKDIFEVPSLQPYVVIPKTATKNQRLK